MISVNAPTQYNELMTYVTSSKAGTTTGNAEVMTSTINDAYPAAQRNQYIMNFKDGTTEYALTSDANLIFDASYRPPQIF